MVRARVLWLVTSVAVVSSVLAVPFAQTAGAAPESALQVALAGVPGLLAASAGLPVSSDVDSAVQTASGDLLVDVPRDPRQGVGLLGDNGLSVTVTSPGAAGAGDASAVALGVAGYANSAPQTDTAVQVLPDGARLLSVIYGPTAPSRFEFPLQLSAGATVEPVETGYRVVAADGSTVAVIDAPWAVDAAGQPVPARYELAGPVLTLVVDHSAAVYPVVADPTVRSSGSVADRGAGTALNGPGGGGAAGGRGCAGSVHAVRNSGCQNGSVDSRTGEFTRRSTDLTRPGRGLSFALTRTYRSGRTVSGPLGVGWTHTYAVSLSVAGSGDVTLDGEDGLPVVFARQAGGGYTGPPAGRSELTRRADGTFDLLRRDQVTYRFTAAGVLQWLKDRNGNTMSVGRASNGEVGTVTDPLGRTVTFAYASGRLSSVRTADGRQVGYGYTGGLLTSFTDPSPSTTRYSYNPDGKIAGVTDGRGNTEVANTYSAGRISRQGDARGNDTVYSWDATNRRATATDPQGHPSVDEYTGENLTGRTDRNGKRTGYGYTARGNRNKTTDPNNNVTDATFDTGDNQTGATSDSGLPSQSSTSATFNARHDRASTTDGALNTTGYGYDPNGNLTSQTNPDTGTRGFGRDPAGSGLLVSTTDENNNTSTTGYTPTGNGLDGQPASVTTPLGDKTTMGYDSAGRLTSTVEARGNEPGANPAAFRATTGYDDNGRVTSRTTAGGDTTTTGYDSNGNRTRVTDARGNITSYSYDRANHLTSVSAPDGLQTAVTSYTYDTAGNLTSRTAQNTVGGVARNQLTGYGYDAGGRLTSVTDPLGGVYSYGYDDNGNLRRTVDANGAATATAGDGVTVNTYDSRDRLTGIDYADTARSPDITYTYTATGKRETMTDAAGTETSTYQPKTDRLISIARGAESFSYTYDPAGSLASRRYPDGTVTTYSYTADARMRTASSGGATTTYGYYPGGLPKSTVLPASNGYTEDRTYQNDGRLKKISNTRTDGTVLSSAAYSYDPNGNPTKVVTEDETVNYTYNSRDMLTLACYGVPPCDTTAASTDSYFRYSYDKVGNRLTKQRPVSGTNEVTTYTYNDNDQLTVKDGPSGRCASTYDPNGNLVNQCGSAFTYNDANQMTKTTKNAGTQTQTYSYDGDGKRLTLGDGTSTTTKFQWDTNNQLPQLARESNGNGTLARRYIQGQDTISMTTGGAGASTYYYHYDGIGSVTDLTNSSGTKQTEYAYEAFGDLRKNQNAPTAPDNNLRYTGEYHDDFTDTYHLRARQYDTHLGRFTQTDPAGSPKNDPYVNRYTYAGNGPTSSVDLSGRFVEVPYGYLYDPSLGALNDYCTYSPDSFGEADFTGPCAYHDICYGTGGADLYACDTSLLADLDENCADAYSWFDPTLVACYVTAGIYHAAVVAAS